MSRQKAPLLLNRAQNSPLDGPPRNLMTHKHVFLGVFGAALDSTHRLDVVPGRFVGTGDIQVVIGG